MAELDVQRKKKSPLPWILLILAILAVLAFLLLNNNKDVTDETVAPTTYDTTIRTGADSLPR